MTDDGYRVRAVRRMGCVPQPWCWRTKGPLPQRKVLFSLGFQPNDEAFAAPKLNIMTVHKVASPSRLPRHRRRKPEVQIL
jgi:hypothetical protein